MGTGKPIWNNIVAIKDTICFAGLLNLTLLCVGLLNLSLNKIG